MGFLQSSLIKQRLSICKNCGLYLKRLGSPAICNPNLFLNPHTNEISTEYKEGFESGCNCIIENKVKDPYNSCPLDKW